MIEKKTDKKEIPISIAMKGFKAQIAKVINESNLPPIILEPIIANIYNQIASAAAQQTASDEEKYSKEE